MNELITYLAPALDNATYVDLFSWTLLLIPTLFVAPLIVYFIIRCISIIKQLV